ncbi:MAG: hypothetical protein DRP58_09020 [Spirochaetes bacterium]|nr:MAG: hypothetical protein DRP58_09020 [Spirochaetota bacterium]
MKNYLDLAQNFIDKDRAIPNEIILRLNEKDRQLIKKIEKMKSQLKTEIDQSMQYRDLEIIKQHESGKKKFRMDLRILYAAAALFIVVLYFPISKSIETKILLKEETVQFVDQLFQGSSETYILVDSGITGNWFSNSIISDYQ